MIFLRWLLVPVCFISAYVCRGSVSPASPGVFETHYRQALAYDTLSFYGSCIKELNLAIAYATDHHLEKQRINATITLAEILRKTRDYDQGISLLKNLSQSTDYPALHVRKLGRMAAICSEWTHSRDTILHYLDSALSLARSLHLTSEMADLYNEYGYTMLAVNREAGLLSLRKSAMLFKEMKDTCGYVSPITNMLRCHIDAGDKHHAEELISELTPLLNNRSWYTAQIEFYKLVAGYHKNFLHDMAGAARWSTLADKSTIRHLESINTIQVNTFRSMYTTRMLRAQVGEMQQAAKYKQDQLERQTQRARELIMYLVILGLLIIIVILLLLRERKLKGNLESMNTELQAGNEKYQMLMKESDHRIKNNLQMVISMLQYAQNQPEENIQDAFKRMSGKIQTVSSLHKHLSFDVHNELVQMHVYFNEITSLYQSITQDAPEIESHVAPVKIKSERMVYFGLILNEMIANTIAHGKGSNVKLCVEPLAQGYRFSYCDASVHDLSAQKGSGTLLIRQLIERVGGILFTFDATSGHYSFVFYE